jgi:hypothetical protein
MLTGERPQGNEVPSTLRSDVPGFLDDAFKRSYTRLDRRFASATEMAATLTARGTPPPPPRPTSAVSPRCVVCEGPIHRDDQFCIHCGAQLVASVAKCGGCGGFVHPSDRFCIYCGKDLGVLA